MQPLITERLVTISFSPLAEVAAWCRRIGLEIQHKPDGVVVINNPHFNFTTAIYDGLDPISRAVCLATAVAGPHFWPEIFPGLLAAVDQEWKARARREKSRQNRGKNDPPTSEMSDPDTVRPTFEMLYKRA